jgi:hypothetical protein
VFKAVWHFCSDRNIVPLVLCDIGHEDTARRAGFTAVAWPEFLFDRW